MFKALVSGLELPQDLIAKFTEAIVWSDSKLLVVQVAICRCHYEKYYKA